MTIPSPIQGGQARSLNSPPRAAYLHVPFCAHHCGYCNFTVIAGRDDLVGDYQRAMALELATFGGPHKIDTLFLGGGTPTRLGASGLSRLLKRARDVFPLAAGYELSIEANPADLDDALLAVLAEEGVTRISLGGQSFHADKLKTLERDHGPDDLATAVKLVQRHISSVSLDLIFGVPGETLADWQRDLAMAIELAPQHISTYGLTFEQGTSFWGRLSKGDLRRADEELERSMYATAIDTLTAAGFEHYEVSNFARPGHRCRHNETYWAGEEYFAAGPGAARYVAGRREMNHRSTTTWLKRVLAGESPMAESETLTPEDRAREMLVFGLRRLEGVKRAEFAARSGFDLDTLAGAALGRFLPLGFFNDDGSRIRLTREGLMISDSLWPYFLRG